MQNAIRISTATIAATGRFFEVNVKITWKFQGKKLQFPPVGVVSQNLFHLLTFMRYMLCRVVGH